MASGMFNSFANGFFYYRNDAGSPGSMEVGVRDASILIENRSFVVVDGIDVYGPGGGDGSTWDSALIKIHGTSGDVIIKNLTISYSDGFGIYTSSGTTNLTYDNLDSHDNGSTGIYMNSQ